MAVWELIRDAMHEARRRGQEWLSTAEVTGAILRAAPGTNRNTVALQIKAHCINDPSKRNFPGLPYRRNPLFVADDPTRHGKHYRLLSDEERESFLRHARDDLESISYPQLQTWLRDPATTLASGLEQEPGRAAVVHYAAGERATSEAPPRAADRITTTELLEAAREFDRLELRGSFYALSRELLQVGFRVQAHLLLLATWNFARFRYAVTTFNIDAFRTMLEDLEPDFTVFDELRFATIKFDEHRTRIVHVFDTLASVNGVNYTGASKLMHLRVPDVFVMWDSYISGNAQVRKSVYEELPIVQSGRFTVKTYTQAGVGYVEFLQDMQRLFPSAARSSGRPLPKLIDEFNYVNITLPIQRHQANHMRTKKRPGRRSSG